PSGESARFRWSKYPVETDPVSRPCESTHRNLAGSFPTAPRIAKVPSAAGSDGLQTSSSTRRGGPAAACDGSNEAAQSARPSLSSVDSRRSPVSDAYDNPVITVSGKDRTWRRAASRKTHTVPKSLLPPNNPGF